MYKAEISLENKWKVRGGTGHIVNGNGYYYNALGFARIYWALPLEVSIAVIKDGMEHYKVWSLPAGYSERGVYRLANNFLKEVFPPPRKLTGNKIKCKNCGWIGRESEQIIVDSNIRSYTPGCPRCFKGRGFENLSKKKK